MTSFALRQWDRWMVGCVVALIVVGMGCGCASTGGGERGWVKLFDGRTFAGWDGDVAHTWRVSEGALVGGSLTQTVPRNEFLASTGRYTNFVLRLKFRLTGTEGFVNAGVQVRSERTANPPNEMAGYQCDMGDGWWGALYDESRRNKVLIKPDEGMAARAVKRGDWNEYLIRCEGRRIQTWINSVPMIDYTEPDVSLPQHGRLGLQVHGGGKALVQYKDIEIQRLP